MLRLWRLRVSPLRRVTFSRRRKSNPKGFALTFGPLAGARGSFAPGSIRGIDSGLLRCTSFRCLPRMNPYTQPADGPFRSRSTAALELTLIVLSGVAAPRAWGANITVGAGLPAMGADSRQFFACTRFNCRNCRRLRSFDSGLCAAFLDASAVRYTAGAYFLLTPPSVPQTCINQCWSPALGGRRLPGPAVLVRRLRCWRKCPSGWRWPAGVRGLVVA